MSPTNGCRQHVAGHGTSRILVVCSFPPGVFRELTRSAPSPQFSKVIGRSRSLGRMKPDDLFGAATAGEILETYLVDEICYYDKNPQRSRDMHGEYGVVVKA